ncbi:cytochrome P450 94B3-like protein [Cinnamomum micranthum f. kanehirae]|uniref:Cytochrome P450 94B3-like protein n=1 Tax=Cinnamomum micranthum f. kanehirae TaxID=337451 RepID=A0A443P8F2_9MAGN|nr:cytochrome P450 94B3-like protein [Cinnamomum micranthum f. kanehirae]
MAMSVAMSHLLLSTLVPLLLFCCCFFFLYCLILHVFHHFREFTGQGPPTYPIIGCLISFSKNQHRLLDWYTELLAESPTQTIVVRRLGARRTIITTNPDNVEYMLKTKFENFPKGEPFTEILGDFLGRGIFNVDGELWHTQRKLTCHEFTTKSLREFMVEMLEIETKERLLPILESASLSGGLVDVQELLRRFAFDIVCKVSLGMDPGCLEPLSPVSDLLRAFDVASEISARRAAAPVFAVWKAKRALNIGSERLLKEAIKHVQVSVMELIRRKKLANEGETQKDRGESNDLLSRLISGGHDEEVIRDMVISFVMAGRDTTSAALTWLLWLLSCYQEIEKEVVNEVAKAASMDAGGRFNYNNLKEMSVLEACLCESMRLYPPVAWDSKHAFDVDTLPDGTSVGKGDRVTYFPYGMGRMKRVWGKDRLEFRPQRWLEEPSSQGGVMKVSPYKFPVFQGGPRVCLGKEMAFIQMKFVAASVLRDFELKPLSQQQPIFVPLLTAHMAGGFKVIVKKRNYM